MSKTVGQNSNSAASSQPDYLGHRQRLRERFLLNGLEGMLDYEIMELVLTMVIPRRDVKPLARALLRKFGNVIGVLSTPIKTLEKFPGLGHSSATGLKIIFSTIQHCLLEKTRKRDLLEDKQEIRDFIRMKLGIHYRESYMLIFLDARNQLIDYCVIAEGTVDYVINYARNIVEETVLQNASKVIMVHNHPSGICTPSQEDIDSTYKIYAALDAIDVELFDHIIVCADDVFSFTEHQLSLKG